MLINRIAITLLIPLMFFSCNRVDDWKPVEYPGRKVGLAYTTWHRESIWDRYWGTPELGKYLSNDRSVIRQHGLWLADAGVDFVFIDWSNDIDYEYGKTRDKPVFDMIEKTVPIIFEEWASIENAPRICIMLGFPHKIEAFTDGRLQRKVDQVYDMFISNPETRDQYHVYLGKPLIMVYAGTPSPFRNGPPQFFDERFTFRFLTGFITEQPNLRDDNLWSKYGNWSWEDRGDQTYTMLDGEPETCTVVAASRAQRKDDPDDPKHVPAIGRNNGETFKARWRRADSLGVQNVLVVSWNEWVTSEQPSAELSKDLEPSLEHGRFYLDLLREEIAKFKTSGP
jgi:hypothetical protein